MDDVTLQKVITTVVVYVALCYFYIGGIKQQMKHNKALIYN